VSMQEAVKRASNVVLISMLTSLAAAAQQEEASYSIDGSVNQAGAGQISGFVQTPVGGKPGTSSSKQPRLEDLNVGNVFFYDLTLSRRSARNIFFLGGNIIRPSGSGTLKAPLTTHGESFPAGTPFDAKLRYDWYQLGYARTFYWQQERLKLFPKIEFALLNFDYRFDTPGTSTSRSYSKGAPRVGVDADCLLSGSTALDGSVAGSIPLGNAPRILTADAKVRWSPGGTLNHSRGTLFLGAGVTDIEYRDSQPLPNHVLFKAAPYVFAGIEARM
jgi:hypothetical protein